MKYVLVTLIVGCSMIGHIKAMQQQRVQQQVVRAGQAAVKVAHQQQAQQVAGRLQRIIDHFAPRVAVTAQPSVGVRQPFALIKAHVLFD